MNETLGSRIATLRKEKNLKQENLAEMLNVSPQAVSKWENDLTCPDISTLPALSKILGVSVDELLSGKKEIEPVITLVPEEKRKDVNEMMLRITVESVDGNKVRVNLPIPLIQAGIEMGLDMSEVSGNANLKNIDFTKILEMAKKGAVGNLIEVESADGDIVNIFIE